MRNLKKVLGLVLCLAMMLSVMVVGAGAAFTDQKDIDPKHQDAVDMCVALNIIKGFPNGSFQPNAPVSREEMAKMICILDNGGKEPQLSTGNTFSDVSPDRWSNKYIEACASRGVVVGIGGGKFSPAGKVTGTQAAKMLLVELGYDDDAQGYSGSDWATKVNIDATKKGYYEDLEDIDVNAPLTREHAAQMVWNALQANEVEYDNYMVTNPDGTISTKITVTDKFEDSDGKKKDGLTLLEDKYGYDLNLMVVTDVSYDEDDGLYTTYLSEIDDDDYSFSTWTPTSRGVDNFDSTTDYSDLYMMAVTVIYDDDDIIAVARDKSAILGEGIVNDLDDNDDGDDSKLTIGDTEYKLESDINDDEVLFFANLNVEDVTDDTNDLALFWQIALVDLDGNGKGDYFITYPTYVAQVSYAGAKSITADLNYKFEDNSIYDDADEDDYILIVRGQNTVANTKAYTLNEDAVITKLDTVEATVTGVKTDSVQMDGAWTDEDFTFGIKPAFAFNSGDDYDMVLVNGIIVAAEESVNNSDDILFISAVDKFDAKLGDSKGTVDVRAYFTDGSDDVITVNKYDGDKLTSDIAKQVKAGQMYTYTVTGDQYNIKAVDNDKNKAGYDAFAATNLGYAEKNSTLGGQRIDKEAVIFVAETDSSGAITSVDVVSGAKLKDVKDDTAGKADILTDKTSGIDYVQVGTLICGKSPVSTSDTMFAYVVDDIYATQIQDGEDDVSVWAIPVWNGEEYDTLYVDSKTAPAVKDGDAISYVISDDLYAEDIAKATLVAITGFENEKEGDVVYYEQGEATVTTYSMDEDVVIIGINSDDHDACATITMDNINTVKKDDKGMITGNGFVVVEDGEITAIFFDIANELVDNDGNTIEWSVSPLT